MIVDVVYEVPVVVRVDTEAGEVDRVIVIAEEISTTEEPPYVAGEPGNALSGHLAKRAGRIAEEEVWPAWEHGL